VKEPTGFLNKSNHYPPAACDLWFGLLFYRIPVLGQELDHFTAQFQNHLTESFRADIKADLGDVPFAGDSSGDTETVSVYILPPEIPNAT
jgi:hypothetical protein